MSRDIQYLKYDDGHFMDIHAIDRGAAQEHKNWDGQTTRKYPAATVGLIKGHIDYPFEGNPENLRSNFYTKPGDQLRLFDIEPTVIHEAFSDSTMRGVTPTVLGIALNEAHKVGLGTVPSDSLSRHSSKLVKKALKLGLIQPNRYNPTGEQTNTTAENEDLSKYQYLKSEPNLSDSKPMSDSAIESGRRMLRNVRNVMRTDRSGPKQPPGHLGIMFHQPTLWDEG